MDELLAGLALLCTWQSLTALSIGTIAGVIVGAIPGVGPAQLIAITLPFTFNMQPVPALLLLLGEFTGGMYGGAITAVLINTPGTPSSIATTFDGYPLARQGKAGKALWMSLIASVFGGLVSTTVLVLSAQHLAWLSLAFGPAEMVGVIVLALLLISAVEEASMTKGLMSALLGALLAVIGTDSITGTPRLTFGISGLTSGVGLVPLLMGLFAIAEIFAFAEKRLTGEAIEVRDTSQETPADRRTSLREIWDTRAALWRGAWIGTIIGILPGLGSSAAAMIGYGYARRKSKTPEAFGKGSLEGIAAPEAANNAETSGALLPFFVLGIPGSTLVAMLGGAFLMHGLTPGPKLFQENGDKMYAIYLGLYATNIVLLLFALAATRVFHLVVRIPQDILYAIVFVLASVGTYALEASLWDIWVMLISGAAAYGMRKIGVPVAPLLIAFILVPALEHSFRQALLISGGSLWVFVQRPMPAVCLGIAAAWLIYSAIPSRTRRTN
jgi:putative tricarboxylic transport membrane protein